MNKKLADIELVIKIPEETYEYWKNHSYEYVLAEAITNGTPLPKGHGRLIDADELLKRISEKAKNPSLNPYTVSGLSRATVIIYDMLNEGEVKE